MTEELEISPIPLQVSIPGLGEVSGKAFTEVTEIRILQASSAGLPWAWVYKSKALT